MGTCIQAINKHANLSVPAELNNYVLLVDKSLKYVLQYPNSTCLCRNNNYYLGYKTND